MASLACPWWGGHPAHICAVAAQTAAPPVQLLLLPCSDLVLETVTEDEAYELQFGNAFDELATDPTNSANVERDDFAIELAMLDE